MVKAAVATKRPDMIEKKDESSSMSGTESDESENVLSPEESEEDERTLGLDFVDGVDLDYMKRREGKLSDKQKKAAAQVRLKG